MTEKIIRSGLHHCFDADLATELKSTDLAILIHHFQFWIRHNAAMNINFHDGKTWTYQTLHDIASYLPYWSHRQVERLIIKLVELKILIKGNYNSTAYDRTVWYAFENEEKFSISRNREMEKPKSGNRNLDIGTPIPDILTYADNNILTPPIPPQKEAASPVPAKAGEKKTKLSSTFSQEVKDLADAVISAIVAVKPDFAIPVNKIPLMTSLDLMIRHDKRSPQKIIDVLRWALADPFWNDKMLKSNVAEYLRKDNRLDSLDAKMNAKPSNSGFNKVDRRCKNRDGTPIDTPHLDNLF